MHLWRHCHLLVVIEHHRYLVVVIDQIGAVKLESWKAGKVCYEVTVQSMGKNHFYVWWDRYIPVGINHLQKLELLLATMSVVTCRWLYQSRHIYQNLIE